MTTLFDGESFDPRYDAERLGDQMRRVWDVARDGAWRTPAEWEAAVGANWASVGARLRDFRKEKFGGMTVERRRWAGHESSGVWQYRLVLERKGAA